MIPDDRPAVSRSLLLAVLLGLILASCARHSPPAPVIAANQRPGAANRGQQPDSVIVAQGDTLYGVARRCDVPLRSLIEVNHLTPPFHLTAGQRLVLPQVRQYVVQAGDTLYSVSRRFGVDASTLARSNDIEPPYPIHVGQALILPAPVQVAATSRTAPVARPQPPQSTPAALPRPETQAPAAVPLPPVVQGAAGTAVPQTPSLSPNQPTKSAPASAPPPAQLALATPPSRTDTLPPPPVKAEPAPGAPPAVSPAPAEQQAVLTPPALPPEPPAGNPPHTGLGFQWPVRGSILVSFGAGESGMHNDGINIAAAKGAPIAAANDGVVAYAGNELRGFGNLLLIKHADGWMTAYAHCDAILVKRGDRVRRGQTIARVGMTGAVSEPQLHFEIRRGSRALDPMTYLPPTSTASAD